MEINCFWTTWAQIRKKTDRDGCKRRAEKEKCHSDGVLIFDCLVYWGGKTITARKTKKRACSKVKWTKIIWNIIKRDQKDYSESLCT